MDRRICGQGASGGEGPAAGGPPGRGTKRWHLKVPAEVDRDVRMLVARRGGRKGDLTRFVVRAVRLELLRAMLIEGEGSGGAGELDFDEIRTAGRARVEAE